jgi:DHA1 family bicyclomycin/chloramphenicol resistance-like MFS transporter
VSGAGRRPAAGRAEGDATGPALPAREFVPLAALLMSLVALAIDTMLPALPVIGQDLGVARRNDVQFIITALFVGLGLGQLVFGPLSDRFGRRPAIHAGLVLFMAGCLMSIFAPTFEVMMGGRILQGFGAAGPRVVTMALVRDQYEGRQMARLMSFVMAVFIFIPTIAPALGQGILWLASWRAIFTTFFLIAAITFAWFTLRQPETLPAERRRSLAPRAIGRAVLEVFRTRSAFGYIVASGCMFAPFIAYLSAAQQIFQEAYTTGALFPVYFGGLVLAIGGASLMNGRLVMRHGMVRLSRTATVCILLVSIPMWVLTFAFAGLPPLWLFTVYLLAVFFGVGLLFANLNALAMEPLGHLAGVGSSVVSSVAVFIAVPLGTLVGLSFDGTMYTQIAAFAVFAAGTLVSMRWAEGGRTAGPDRDPAAGLGTARSTAH